MKKTFIISAAILFIIVISVSYFIWNTSNPQNTCARCHEISPSHAQWKSSAHAGVRCSECHGTALSGGINSLMDKMNMVYTHFTEKTQNDDIRLTEQQIMEVDNRCIACHQAEYAGWLRSGHAVNYKEIFLDSAHNAMEKPYWDCLRCHGMFYDGNINDLMTLEGDHSEWKIRDVKQEMRPAIPCLSCHQIHTENPCSVRYISLSDSGRIVNERNPTTALYIRPDKMYLRSDKLPECRMFDGDKEITVPSDPNTRLCMQCHAPNFKHQAGSEDDRTVTGVHEGISCIACHQPHSGETKASCAQCHPSLSNEQTEGVFKQPHSYNIRIENYPNSIK